MKIAALKSLLAPKVYPDTSSEVALQNRIEEILQEADIDHKREVELGPGDRIDFLAGTVGIEIKLQAPVTKVMRQLHRYAQSGLIEELLLVTTHPRLSLVPKKFNGKPIRVLVLITTIL